ncbi:response regulator [Pokkaliibacter sp. MBI-7]|uniref:response regulator n=1 Tax=Pokkaliibacter sp. MBI-7 TaxID=3040600 RepID=UPI0024472B5A|nr:response regulator [Pokkaliibacter sp. MBI-7]MDH2434030.1 response regulator [Pokkaliibacter sp. MBI-7]
MDELKRIMHVEDDPSIQAVARVALEVVGGFQVLTCSSGQEALDKVQDFAPHFILLDVMMPGIDGAETLERLRKLVDLTDIPVAFMTAKVQPEEVAYYHSLGASDVIIKPFSPMQLATQVRNIWNKHHDR